MIILYGIPNCDTVQKARRWLDQQGVNYRFHDFRTDGLEPAKVKEWIADLGLDKLINKRSTSWKHVSAAERERLDEKSAVQLVLGNPTLIKRPLLETGKVRTVGFSADQYQAIFN